MTSAQCIFPNAPPCVRLVRALAGRDTQELDRSDAVSDHGSVTRAEEKSSTQASEMRRDAFYRADQDKALDCRSCPGRIPAPKAQL